MNNVNDNAKIHDFEALQNIDILTVDIESLIDIRDIKIDPALPFEEKAIMFINQIKNPYCFKYNDIIVKVSHADTQMSIDDCLEGLYRSL